MTGALSHASAGRASTRVCPLHPRTVAPFIADRVPELMHMAEHCFLCASSKARDGSGHRGFVGSLAPMCGLGAIRSLLVRFRPTTPKLIELR